MNSTNSIDALLPPEIAAKAESIGVAKGQMAFLPLLGLAILAGAFIAMGAVFSTTITTTTVAGPAAPWGISKALAGLAFSLGLILVVVGGAELFTGNNLLIMATVSGKISPRLLLRNWIVVYLGNFIGAVATAVLIFLAAHHTLADGQLGLQQLKIADAKCHLGLVEALTRGIYCNALVCLAVWLCFSCRTTGDKILAILFPITAFVAAGFEHCVANMYFIPVGMLVKSSAAPEFWSTIAKAPADFPHLTLAGFLVTNLIPVTIGNIIGGAVFVGGAYWVVYRRPAQSRGASEDCQRGPVMSDAATRD